MAAGPLIDSDNSLMLMAALALIVGAAWLFARTKIGAIISPAPLVVVLAVALSNLGIIPFASPVYQFSMTHLMPCGVTLLLLGVDLRAIFRTSRVVLLAFAIGLTGSAAGLAAAYALVPFGEEGPLIATLYSTVVSGGVVNMMSVGEAVGIFRTHPNLLGAVIAGSVVVDVAYLAIISQAARWPLLTRAFARRAPPLDLTTFTRAAAPQAGVPFDPASGLAVALALAALIVAASYTGARALGVAHLGIVFAGAFAVVVANLWPRFMSRLGSAQPLALWFLLVFLAGVSAAGEFAGLTALAAYVALFVSILYATHLAVLFALGWILRVPLPALAVGSLAGIGGPSTTAAIAASQGWSALVMPGVLCAMLGLAIGTYIGLATYALLAP